MFNRREAMNRNHFAAGLAFAGLVCLLMMARSSPPVLGQAAAQAPHYGEGGLPQFEKDPVLPKIPSKWRMGFGSAVAVDEQDHVCTSAARARSRIPGRRRPTWSPLRRRP